jgi:hypothetical protein
MDMMRTTWNKKNHPHNPSAQQKVGVSLRKVVCQKRWCPQAQCSNHFFPHRNIYIFIQFHSISRYFIHFGQKTTWFKIGTSKLTNYSNHNGYVCLFIYIYKNTNISTQNYLYIFNIHIINNKI